MRVTRHAPDRLELSGLPGGAAAVVVPIGLALVGALAALFWLATGALIPLIAGGVMLLIALAAAAVSCTAREWLTLDLPARTARYRRRSLIPSDRTDLTVPFDAAHSVSIERSTLRSPDGRMGHPIEVWTARLRLTKPRRAIELAQTQGGPEQAVRPIAEAVARALGIPLADESGDETETRAPGSIGARLAHAPELSASSFGPRPEGARVSLHLAPDGQSVAIEWKTLGGPALPVLGLLGVGVFVVLSTAMTLQAFGVPVLTWIAGGSPSAPVRPAPLPAAPIAAALVAMSTALWLAWLLILELWLFSRRRLSITPERITLSRLSPSARILGTLSGGLLARRWSAPTDDVRSIRTHEDAVEVRTSTRTCAATIHLPADGEAAWAAKIIRASVRALASTTDDDEPQP
ncbi:MAG TPA: hypothetical protein PKE29_03120 [Phycisphaerales bacterium]|nr:hypothetical protein [Phycisphaerales bacterium]